jgi:hypothetical protein
MNRQPWYLEPAHQNRQRGYARAFDMTRHYYWFEPYGGRLGYGDGRKPVAGTTHTVDVAPELCRAGLHASRHPHDALQYAGSEYLWRVTLSGNVVHDDDKSAATERTYVARIDATDLLWRHARLCALEVIDLWDAPDVVRQYLRTGDESKRHAETAAAWAAARAAAWDAAWDAARAAARAAAWDAARADARADAWDAAWDAAWHAATAAARAAAWDAAWDAARDAQRRRFALMVNQAFREAQS